MKQSGIFVLDKCEITVNKKLYSEPHVDLHNLRKSNKFCAPFSLTKIKSVEACEQFCSILKCWFTVLSDDKRQTYETRILTQ